MPKYLSGKSKTTAVDRLDNNRYKYLDISQAEPNPGYPGLHIGIADNSTGPVIPGASPGLPVGTQYQLITVWGDNTATRYWKPIGGGQIPASFSVYEEGSLVGSAESITQLDFRGLGIGVTAVTSGVAATITVAPPGNNGSVLFKDRVSYQKWNGSSWVTDYRDDFSTATDFVYSTVGILTVGTGLHISTDFTSDSPVLNIGVGGSIFRAVSVGTSTLVGIGTTTPEQNLDVQGNIKVSNNLILKNAGTIIDYSGSGGGAANILSRSTDGIEWVPPDQIAAGAAGTVSFLQYHKPGGVLGGTGDWDTETNEIGVALVWDNTNKRVGIGSTLPRALFDVLGNSIFTGITTFAGITTVTGDTLFTKQLSVSGLSTFVGAIDANDGINASSAKIEDLTAGRVVFAGTNKEIEDSSDLTFSNSILFSKNLDVSGISTIGKVKISDNKITTKSGSLYLDTGNTSGIQINKSVFIDDSTGSTSFNTGALIVDGGVGVELSINVGGGVSIGGTSDPLGIAVTLAAAGGITTTGGDLYVNGDIFLTKDIFLDEGNFQKLNVKSGIATFHGDINALSNVGIGTTNPDNLLTLNATTNPTINIKTDNILRTALIADTGNNETVLASYESYPLVFSTSDGGGTAERLRITGIGSVGIGTNDPNATLEVYRATQYADNPIIQARSNHNTNKELKFEIDGDGKAYFNGDVGIGSTIPAGKLDISHDTQTNLLVLKRNTGNSGTFTVSIGGADPGVIFDATGISSDFVFKPGGTETLRIDSDGRLLLGITDTSTLADGFGAAFQIQGTSETSSSISITRNSAGEHPPYITFAKSRGTSVGSNTAVADGDNLGDIDFKGSDGSGDFNLFAKIRASVDGTPGGSDAPGRLSFFTTADDGINNQERLRIASDGNVGINQNNPNKAKLHVVAGTGSTEKIVAKFRNPHTDADVKAKIGLVAGYSDTANDVEAHAYVGAQREGLGNNAALFFETTNGSTATEVLRIKSDGKVGIGTNNPESILEAQRKNTTAWPFENDNTGTYSYTAYSQELKLRNTAAGDHNPNTFTGIFFEPGRLGEPVTISSPIVGGSGYSDASNVATNDGSGSGLKVDITVATVDDVLGVVQSVNINSANPGSGYKVGDVISIDGNGSGDDAYFSITSVNEKISAARIGSVKTGNYKADIVFGTTNGDTSNSFGERLRITADGDVGIGTTNPTGINAVSSGNEAILAVGILTASKIYGPVIGALTPDGLIDIESYIQHQEDTDTKFGFPDENTFTIETNTAERLRITSGGNVGIGTTNPATKTQIHGGDATLLISGNTAVGSAQNTGGTLALGGIYHTNGSITGWAQIKGFKDNNTSNNYNGYLSFTTRNTTDDYVERLRITSAGDVGIGTDTVNTTNEQVGRKFGIFSSQNNVLVSETTSSSHGFLIEGRRKGRDTNKPRYAQIGLQQDGDGDGIIKFSTAADSDNVTERLSIDSKGAITVGKRSDIHASAALARFGIDCHGRNALSDVGDASKYGLAFYNDPTTDHANGIGFFNDDGNNCGGYILHQDKGSNNIGDIIFGTSESSDTPIERLRITYEGDVGIGTTNPTGINAVSSDNKAILAVGVVTANTISATNFLGTLKGTIHNDVSTFTLNTNLTDILSRSNNQLSAKDAGSDKLVFWDEDGGSSVGVLTYASVSYGLSFDDTTLKGSTYTLPGTGTESTDWAGTGSATLTLTQAGAATNTDAITVTAGSNIQITKTGGNDFSAGFTISAQDTNDNTTYDLDSSGKNGSSSDSANIKWTLSDNGGNGQGSVTLNAGNNITFSGLDGNGDGGDASITINSAGSVNTTYTLPVFSETSAGVTTTGIRLQPDVGTATTVKLIGENGISITGDATLGTLTIDGKDAAGTSYDLSAGGTDAEGDDNGNGTIILTAGGDQQDTVTITAGYGVTINNTGDSGFTINASKESFASNAFTRFTLDGIQDNENGEKDVVAETVNDTMTFATSGGMSITLDASHDKITFESANTNTEYKFLCHQDEGDNKPVNLRLSTPPTGDDQTHQDIEIAGASGEIDITKSSEGKLEIGISDSFSAGLPLSAWDNRFDVLAWTHEDGQTLIGKSIYFYLNDTNDNRTNTSPNAYLRFQLYDSGSGGYFDISDDFFPNVSGVHNLGHSARRWNNIYVNDLQLSNESKKDTGGNDVDGTWGDWTLQEGEENIYMINNRTGKKYAMMLREV